MKNKRLVLSILIGIFVVGILLVGGCAKSPSVGEAEKEKVIELKYSGLYNPPTAYASSAEKWIKYVQEKTNGKVHITPYWGGTLISGKEGKAQLIAGMADIAHATIYSESGIEILDKIPMLLASAPNPVEGIRVSRALLAKFPAYQQEVKDVVTLGFTNAQDVVLISRKPVRKLEDLKGMTVGCALAYEPLFKAYGASSIMMPPAEQYIALEKGTIDATFLPIETLNSFKFAEVAKFTTTNLKVSSGAKPTQFMNLDSFNKLPPDIQKIFQDSVGFFADAMLKDFDVASQAGIDYGKKMNNEFITLSKEDEAKWLQTIETSQVNAAKGLDALGKPGTEMLKEVKSLLKK